MKLFLSLLSMGLITGAQYTFAYGVSGCGLGSVIISRNSFSSQTLAASTNGPTQPFAITSGTSNCKSSSWVMIDKEKAYFAELHQPEISMEMAQGEGEKLQALAGLYGCNGDASKGFAKMAQANYSKILPAEGTTPIEMLNNLNTVFSTSRIKSTCHGS